MNHYSALKVPANAMGASPEHSAQRTFHVSRMFSEFTRGPVFRWAVGVAAMVLLFYVALLGLLLSITLRLLLN